MVVERKADEIVIHLDKGISDTALNDIVRFIKLKSATNTLDKPMSDESAEEKALYIARDINKNWLAKNREKYNLW